jgi:CheY-like chemotaxis protein
VLDDDFDINNLIKVALQNHGYNVFGFTDPLLALEHFKINLSIHSLVMSDLRMPLMNGFEFVRKVKKMNPKIKVLLMTAFEINDREFTRVLPELKIEGFIQKTNINEKIEWYYRHAYDARIVSFLSFVNPPLKSFIYPLNE